MQVMPEHGGDAPLLAERARRLIERDEAALHEQRAEPHPGARLLEELHRERLVVDPAMTEQDLADEHATSLPGYMTVKARQEARRDVGVIAVRPRI